jgi:hypothetical protein
VADSVKCIERVDAVKHLLGLGSTLRVEVVPQAVKDGVLLAEMRWALFEWYMGASLLERECPDALLGCGTALGR